MQLGAQMSLRGVPSKVIIPMNHHFLLPWIGVFRTTYLEPWKPMSLKTVTTAIARAAWHSWRPNGDRIRPFWSETRAVIPSLYTMLTSVWIYLRLLRWPSKLVIMSQALVSPPLLLHEESIYDFTIITPTNQSIWVPSLYDLFPQLHRSIGDSATSMSRYPTNRTVLQNRACSDHGRSTGGRVVKQKFQLKWQGLVITRENLQKRRWVCLTQHLWHWYNIVGLTICGNDRQSPKIMLITVQMVHRAQSHDSVTAELDETHGEFRSESTVPRNVLDSLIYILSLGHLMESVQSLTDEITLLRKENVALTRENIVSRILNSHHFCFDTYTAL